MAFCVEPKADCALPKSVVFSFDAVLNACVDCPLLMFSSQVFGEVCELAIDAREPRSSQWFLDHLLELPRDEALQPAKPLQFQYVTKPFYLPASERRGLGMATHKTKLRDRLHVDTVPDGPILF